MIWVSLTLSLAWADKLDRTYLPPPGSQYAGGRSEEIQVPFEYSEANFPANPDYILNRKTAIGIDRKGPKENDDKPVDGNLDGLISLPCNKSLTNSLNNGPCIVNSNSKQYLSTLNPSSIITSTTLTPASKISNFPERGSIKPQNNVNTSATSYDLITKGPLIPFNIKLPERIQAKSDREAVVLNYENALNPEGYTYSFDTSNGIHGDENGVTLNGVRAKGSYSYIGDDGKLYRVIYTADENGFRPEGDHLPTPPPIPEAILEVIEKAYKDKKAGIIDDGSYDENKYGHKKYEKDYNKSNPYKSTKNLMKLNEYLNSGNILPQPNQDNVYLKNQENKQNDDISNKHLSRPAYITNYYNSKNSSLALPDDYEEIDYDDGSYQKLDTVNPIPKNLDSKYNQNTSITNKNVKYNDGTNSSPTIDSRLYNESGYPYYSSQNEKKFPTRFSDIRIDEDQEIFQKDSQISPKPFMTPYVLRNEDNEPQNDESNEKLYDEHRYHSNDKINQEYNNENYPIDGSNAQESNSSISFVKNDEFKSTNNGYFYPKAVNLDVISSKQLLDVNVSHTTYKPFDFSTRSSISPNEGKYYSGPREKDFRSSTTASLTEISTEYQTSTILSYLFKTYENAYGETNEPNYFNNDLLSTEKNIEISIPKLRPSYSPNIDIMNSDTFNFPSSTEKILGEDFSGPKRPQSFDPLTGYQY